MEYPHSNCSTVAAVARPQQVVNLSHTISNIHIMGKRESAIKSGKNNALKKKDNYNLKPQYTIAHNKWKSQSQYFVQCCVCECVPNFQINWFVVIKQLFHKLNLEH